MPSKRILAGGMTSVLLISGVALAEPPEDRRPPDQPPAAEGVEPHEAIGERLPPFGEWPDRPFFDSRPEVDWPKIREFLQEHFPQWADELYRLERNNPILFARRMREIAPRALRLMNELEEDEELGMLSIEEERLDVQIRWKARQYARAADEPERQQIATEVRDLVGRRFEVRHRRGERLISQLDARLERMRRRLERRARDREQLVAEEVDEVLHPSGVAGRDRSGPPGGDPSGPPVD